MPNRRPLSRLEARSLHGALRKQHMASDDPNFLAVGIGRALRGGIVDKDRPLSAIYAVRQKLDRPRAKHRIKETIQASYTVAGRRRTVSLPTDVIELGDMVPTAVPVSTDNDRFSAGYVISWKDASEVLRWGFLTVGHGVANAGSSAAKVQFGVQVDVQAIAVTSPDDPVDAAILEVSGAQLARMFGTGLSATTPLLPFRPLRQLVQDSQARDRCMMEIGTSVYFFELVGFFSDEGSNGPLVPDLPGLKNVFFGQTPPQYPTFRPGTSGAAWNLAPHIPAAMQVASNDGVFNHGFATSVEDLLKWASASLGAQVSLRAIL